MEQAFQVAIPLLGNIQMDIGTLLSAIVFLMLLVTGFDLVMKMLMGNWEYSRNNQWADKFSTAAKEARYIRDSYDRGSIGWEENNLIYKNLLSRSAKYRVKGWKYD